MTLVTMLKFLEPSLRTVERSVMGRRVWTQLQWRRWLGWPGIRVCYYRRSCGWVKRRISRLPVRGPPTPTLEEHSPGNMAPGSRGQCRLRFMLRRALNPTEALSALYETVLRYFKSSVTPSSMLDVPTYGTCPALRIANLHFVRKPCRGECFDGSHDFICVSGLHYAVGVVRICCVTSKYHAFASLVRCLPGKQ